MVIRTATMKDKGQITVPVEIRKKFDLHTGSRMIFEDRGDYIAVMPAESIVDRTAGSLAKYAKNGPVELKWDRDAIWTGIALERWTRLQEQLAQEASEPGDIDAMR